LFTGIVEATGKIQTLRARAGATGTRVSISTALDLAAVPLGGSIAVDGVCLTVIARRGRRFEADLGPETLALTTLGQRRPGDEVHLERPLRMGDPLGGHLVAGHVDGVGRVLAARPVGQSLELEIAPPAELDPFVATKGSITVDGVSLTVNRVSPRGFSVTLIPHTLSVTHLGRRRPGDQVNLEADLLARHVARLLEARLPAARASRRSRS
jgi:riboflavin synthase alpha subunit